MKKSTFVVKVLFFDGQQSTFFSFIQHMIIHSLCIEFWITVIYGRERIFRYHIAKRGVNMWIKSVYNLFISK